MSYLIIIVLILIHYSYIPKLYPSPPAVLLRCVVCVFYFKNYIPQKTTQSDPVMLLIVLVILRHSCVCVTLCVCVCDLTTQFGPALPISLSYLRLSPQWGIIFYYYQYIIIIILLLSLLLL